MNLHNDAPDKENPWNFSEDFPAHSYEEWRAAVEQLLKGKPYEKIMLTPTAENITLDPMYRADDVADLAHRNNLPGQSPYVRHRDALGAAQCGWKIAQEIPYPQPKTLNKALLHDLMRGQNAVNLVLDTAGQMGDSPDHCSDKQIGQQGTSIASLADWETALEDVVINAIDISVKAPLSALYQVAQLAALAQKQNVDWQNLQGTIGQDPLSYWAQVGQLPLSVKDAYSEMAALLYWAKEHMPQLKTITVSTQVYQNSGCSAAQELAYAMATGVEYIREMQARKLDVAEITPRMQFDFAIGNNFFMEISKFRAARLLWARVVEAFGGDAESQKMDIHARTSLYNKTVYDAYVNMLRITSETFSAIMGGCNSIHSGCFDELFGLPSEFSRRIARNTQIILQEESHFDKVIDPAGGSWYIEKQTALLAEEAWKLFQAIEKEGGMQSALVSGLVQTQMDETVAFRKKNVNKRKDVLVGTNMYPNLQEKLPEALAVDWQAVKQERKAAVSGTDVKLTVSSWDDNQLMPQLIKAFADGASLYQVSSQVRGAQETLPQITPLRVHRLAEDFEGLRQQTEAYAQANGARPKIFLANMGPIPQHKPRADFSAGFFAVAGFDVVSNNGFATAGEAAEAACQSGAKIAVVCSTDPTYPELVPPFAQKVKATMPDMQIILAGHPRDQKAFYQENGVDEFIYMGANVLELLTKLMKTTGVWQ